MQTANELANEHKLSRQTMSVQRDPKRDTVVVVEQISCSGMEYPRSETYYKMYDDVPTEKMNDLLAHAKNDATLQFLGLPLGTVEVPQTELIKAAVEVVIEKTKPAVTTRKRKPAAKKAVAKVTKEQIQADQAVIKAAADVAAQAIADAADVPLRAAKEALEETEVYVAPEETKVEVENIVYSKASREHINLLRPLIQASFGAEWKKDDEKRNAVREVVSKLNGKVAVTDAQGVPLPSFAVAAQEVIESVKEFDL